MSDLVKVLRGFWNPSYAVQRPRASALCEQAANEIERLERELAEARRDAERYRWLSSQNDPIIWKYLGGMDDDQIDEAIDMWIADDALIATAQEPPAKEGER